MKIGIIGGGVMGEAVLKSIISKKLVSRQDIAVSDVSEPRRNILKKKYNIKTTSSNREAIADAQTIILAVKPQDIAHILHEIPAQLKNQLVISIAAGISIDTLCKGLNYEQVVRAMPNTPAQVGKGMTAWTARAGLTAENHETARKMLAAMGEEYFFADEKYLDMATAISGSGPAYVFLFIESMIDAGVHIGLPRNVAEKFVIQTIAGSVEAMKKMSRHPAELKNMVTSPGGTTTEALLLLESGGLRSLIINAVTAAYTKAKNLGSK